MSDSDGLNIANRLKELKSSSYWLGCFGEPIPRNGLDWLAAAFAKHYPATLPPPYLYPTLMLGISAEWNFGNGWEAAVDINLSTRQAEYVVWGPVDAGNGVMGELNLDTKTGWRKLKRVIRQAMDGGT